MTWKQLLKTSRPRFWFYVLGPYLLGLAAAGFRADMVLLTILFGLYFSFPANLLIYGINDIFDYETDKRNAKKQGYERLLGKAQHKVIWFWVLLLNLPVLAFSLLASAEVFAALVAFLFFAVFYSAPPIRAKTKPFLDSAFNILYLFPSWVGYYLLGGSGFAWAAFAAGAAWVMAMHAYSAVPDITADKQAGLQTIATVLGVRGTLWLCFGLYTLSVVLAVFLIGPAAAIMWLVYAQMMVASLHAGSEHGVMKIYRYFPAVNVVVGMVVFFLLLFH